MITCPHCHNKFNELQVISRPKDSQIEKLCPYCSRVMQVMTPKPKEMPEKGCEYNYHDPLHEDLCTFEIILDNYLKPDDKLTKDAQELRAKLIIGVKRMCGKVKEFEKAE